MIILFAGILALAEWLWALLVGILVTVMWLDRSRRRNAPPPPETQAPADLSLAFQSAIPTLTQELNLEVATAEQLETMVLEDRGFWGNNRIEIQVPVTYRYHICLRDVWRLSSHDHTLFVIAPRLRAAEPPAIHTDRLQIREHRGIFRLPPFELREKALRQLTPMLTHLAEDDRRLALIRDTARFSVKAFVRQWLMRKGDWGKKIHTIELEFDLLPNTSQCQSSLSIKAPQSDQK